MGTRETKAYISLNALKHNYERIKEVGGKEVFSVLKANAYGHGDVEVGQYLETLNAPLFCVSSLDEAIHLRQQGIKTDIIIFSYVNPEYIKDAVEYDFIYSAVNNQWIETVDKLKLSLRIHIEMNMGMNRYGFKSFDEISTIFNNHQVEGIYMHFQRPDDSDKNHETINKFEEGVKRLPYIPKWVHVGNVSITLVRESSLINAVRMGLGLYGYRHDISDLEPVLEVYSKVTHIDSLIHGETIGYEYDYVVEEDGIYGTMPIGYADGFDMRNANLPVYINGKAYPIVGRICMDQTMLQLDETVKFYDEIEVLGKHRTLHDISKVTDKSLYVLLTDISPRIERVYR